MLGKNFHMLITLSVVVLCTFYLRQPQENDFLSDQNAVQHPAQRNLDVSADILVATLCQDFVGATNFDPEQQSYADRCKESLESFRGGNPMLDIVNQQDIMGDTEADDQAVAHRDQAFKDYAKTLLKIEIFLGVCFFFTFVCYWGFFLNLFAFGKQICFCFNYGDNTNIKVKWLCGLVSLMFIASLVGVGIAGLGVSSQVQESANGAICTLSFSFQDLVNGKADRKWMGLTNTSASLGSLLTDLTQVQDDVTSVSTSYKTFVDGYANITQGVKDTYNSHQDDALPRPDNSTMATYMPNYIQTYGPPTAQDTTTYYIQTAADNNNVGINDTYTQLFNGVASISDESELWTLVNRGKNITDQAVTAASTLMSLSNTYSQQISQTTEEVESILHTIFQSLCLIPIFCIFWWFLTYILKARIFVCLSLGWILLSLLALTGWIISLILVPSNITLMETCGVIQTALADNTTFNQTINLFSTKADSVIRYMSPCLFQTDASIPHILNISDSLDNFQTNYNSSSSALQDIALRKNLSYDIGSEYDNDLNLMTQYLNYNDVDSDYITTDLKTVNQYSNHSNATCEPMIDIWVFNVKSCDAASGATVLGTDATDYYNVGHPTCIGVDNWMGGGDSYGNKSIEDRYAVLRYLKDCQDADGDSFSIQTQAIVDGFVSNRKALKTSITEIQAELQNVSLTYQAYIDSINALPATALSMNQSMTQLYSTLYDSNTGLTNNLNCSIIQDSLNDFSTNMCIGLIPIIFQLSVLSLLLSIFACFGACSMFCFARRMRSYGLGEEIVDERQTKLNEPKGTEVQMATRVY